MVATDTGFAKKARNFAEMLDAPLAIVEKRRMGNDGKTESLGLIGSVEGRNALIVDDEIDTAGSMIQAASWCGSRARAMFTPAPMHGVLSGHAIERLRAIGSSELVLTDTVPLPPEKPPEHHGALGGGTLRGGIQRIHEERSVAELFQQGAASLAR